MQSIGDYCFVHAEGFEGRRPRSRRSEAKARPSRGREHLGFSERSDRKDLVTCDRIPQRAPLKYATLILMSELHCIITGRVQGVAFRDFVRSIAQELNLNGFVSNLPDGSVEVVAQGEFGVLKVFLNHLRTGPSHAKVAEVYDEWSEPTKEYLGFEIV